MNSSLDFNLKIISMIYNMYTVMSKTTTPSDLVIICSMLIVVELAIHIFPRILSDQKTKIRVLTRDQEPDECQVL